MDRGLGLKLTFSLRRLLPLTAALLAATLPLQPASAQNNWLQDLGRQSAQSGDSDFLPVELAYPFSYEQHGDKLTLSWNVQPGYYMYRRSFRFPNSATTVADSQLPQGNVVDDIEYGITEVYEQPLTMQLALTGSATELAVEFQGCAKAGLCYPPTQRTIFLNAVDQTSAKRPVRLNDAAKLRARIGSGLPAMLQLTAEWSAASKLMQRNLFNQPVVLDALQPLLWLQADVTDRNDATTLLAEFKAAGPDTFVFYAATGEEKFRLSGRQTVDSLLAALQQLKDSETQ